MPTGTEDLQYAEFTREIERLRAERAELLAALEAVVKWRADGERPIKIPRLMAQVNAAVNKAEGKP
jgi:hypothetical protein